MRGGRRPGGRYVVVAALGVTAACGPGAPGSTSTGGSSTASPSATPAHLQYVSDQDIASFNIRLYETDRQPGVTADVALAAAQKSAMGAGGAAYSARQIVFVEVKDQSSDCFCWLIDFQPPAPPASFPLLQGPYQSFPRKFWLFLIDGATGKWVSDLSRGYPSGTPTP